jgi:hypothetical protein
MTSNKNKNTPQNSLTITHILFLYVCVPCLQGSRFAVAVAMLAPHLDFILITLTLQLRFEWLSWRYQTKRRGHCRPTLQNETTISQALAKTITSTGRVPAVHNGTCTPRRCSLHCTLSLQPYYCSSGIVIFRQLQQPLHTVLPETMDDVISLQYSLSSMETYSSSASGNMEHGAFYVSISSGISHLVYLLLLYILFYSLRVLYLEPSRSTTVSKWTFNWLLLHSNKTKSCPLIIIPNGSCTILPFGGSSQEGVKLATVTPVMTASGEIEVNNKYLPTKHLKILEVLRPFIWESKSCLSDVLIW